MRWEPNIWKLNSFRSLISSIQKIDYFMFAVILTRFYVFSFFIRFAESLKQSRFKCDRLMNFIDISETIHFSFSFCIHYLNSWKTQSWKIFNDKNEW
jgi:hypothetical protein